MTKNKKNVIATPLKNNKGKEVQDSYEQLLTKDLEEKKIDLKENQYEITDQVNFTDEELIALSILSHFSNSEDIICSDDKIKDHSLLKSMCSDENEYILRLNINAHNGHIAEYGEFDKKIKLFEKNNKCKISLKNIQTIIYHNLDTITSDEELAERREFIGHFINYHDKDIFNLDLLFNNTYMNLLEKFLKVFSKKNLKDIQVEKFILLKEMLNIGNNLSSANSSEYSIEHIFLLQTKILMLFNQYISVDVYQKFDSDTIEKISNFHLMYPLHNALDYINQEITELENRNDMSAEVKLKESKILIEQKNSINIVLKKYSAKHEEFIQEIKDFSPSKENPLNVEYERIFNNIIKQLPNSNLEQHNKASIYSYLILCAKNKTKLQEHLYKSINDNLIKKFDKSIDELSKKLDKNPKFSNNKDFKMIQPKANSKNIDKLIIELDNFYILVKKFISIYNKLTKHYYNIIDIDKALKDGTTKSKAAIEVNLTNDIYKDITEIVKELKAQNQVIEELSEYSYMNYDYEIKHISQIKKLLGFVSLKDLKQSIKNSYCILTLLSDNFSFDGFQNKEYWFQSEHMNKLLNDPIMKLVQENSTKPKTNAVSSKKKKKKVNTSQKDDNKAKLKKNDNEAKPQKDDNEAKPQKNDSEAKSQKDDNEAKSQKDDNEAKLQENDNEAKPQKDDNEAKSLVDVEDFILVTRKADKKNNPQNQGKLSPEQQIIKKPYATKFRYNKQKTKDYYQEAQKKTRNQATKLDTSTQVDKRKAENQAPKLEASTQVDKRKTRNQATKLETSTQEAHTETRNQAPKLETSTQVDKRETSTQVTQLDASTQTIQFDNQQDNDNPQMSNNNIHNPLQQGYTPQMSNTGIYPQQQGYTPQIPINAPYPQQYGYTPQMSNTGIYPQQYGHTPQMPITNIHNPRYCYPIPINAPYPQRQNYPIPIHALHPQQPGYPHQMPNNNIHNQQQGHTPQMLITSRPYQQHGYTPTAQYPNNQSQGNFNQHHFRRI